MPIFAGSLRAAPDERYAALGTLDALVVTMLAAGGSVPATAGEGGDGEAWDVERMAALDIPVLQGLCLATSRAARVVSDEGVNPLDSAGQIAIPEFDGRIITAPFSFKEIDEDGLPRYMADPERCERVARPVHVTTARRPAEAVTAGQRNIVVMLGGALDLAGLEDWTIWSGANLGMPGAETVAGRGGDVLDDLSAARARAKSTAGWVTDVYLLREGG